MFIGIDIGTQSLKVLVSDPHLAPKGTARHSYQASFPQLGWAEQNPALWEEALAPTIAAALTGNSAALVRRKTASRSMLDT